MDIPRPLTGIRIVIVGDKELFAIEFDYSGITVDRFAYGKIIYWVSGIPLGNPEDAEDLCSFYRGIQVNPVSGLDNIDTDLFNLPALELMKLLKAGDWKTQSHLYRNFLISYLHTISTFDRDAVFIVLLRKSISESRIVWFNKHEKTGEVFIQQSFIQNVFDQTLSRLENLLNSIEVEYKTHQN